MITFYAHKREDGTYQLLSEHLSETGALAAGFASHFDAKDWGMCAGYLHDIGKYAPAFQKRLEGSPEEYEHSAPGAVVAQEYKNLPLEYCIAGHHTGLPDGGSPADAADLGTLYAKLSRGKKNIPACSGWKAEVPVESVLPKAFPPLLTNLGAQYTYAFFIRMLFSCLVDADFLDTEHFMADEHRTRDSGDSLSDLRTRLECVLTKLETKTGKINEYRQEILHNCRKSAAEKEGLFRLTVPTGGGKTLSSMAFALDHAAAHPHFRRIIYIIPYVSIIRQTAQIFREIFGEDNVLEHDSSVEFPRGESGEPGAMELASENWDKPVVVTTNVQFF